LLGGIEKLNITCDPDTSYTNVSFKSNSPSVKVNNFKLKMLLASILEIYEYF